MRKALSIIFWLALYVDYEMVLGCLGFTLFAFDAIIIAATGATYMSEIALTNLYISGVICAGLLLLRLIKEAVFRIFEES